MLRHKSAPYNLQDDRRTAVGHCRGCLLSIACMYAGVKLDLWCRCVIGSASRGVRTNRSITLLTVVPNLDASLADKGTRLPRVGSQVKQAEQARLPPHQPDHTEKTQTAAEASTVNHLPA